ncbi:MAG: outer membrane lipoprotein carrier protein LolA, partial [Elusimicrobia bacterium]|nr:outer membrane lipoprotein carrier protein LolA [Elusimicrobiota bacterium]
MRYFLLAVLLLPSAARAKKPTKMAVSTAAAGAELTTYGVSTAPLTLDLIAARFGEVDARMKTMSAEFRQFVRMDGSDTVQQVEGDVLFKKPDLMRLNHRLPEKQTVVSDGIFLWVYRPSTDQVIQTRLDAWRKKEPLAKGLLDFGRSADLLKRYAAELSTVSAPGDGGYRTFVVTLTPKPADRAAS